MQTQGALAKFHPAVREWFRASFSAPTDCQGQAWPVLKSGQNLLLAAPTGSGKTLAAFLAAIDELVGLSSAGLLLDETRVVYVSPLKALSSDVQINLQRPLDGVRAQLGTSVDIRALVRTGDTPASQRAAMRKKAPHILVTTPESLYVLLTSASGRRMLATTRTVIVDEIHAIASSKRGAHLALSLERLSALTGDRLQRIGLSATQKPIEIIARLLCGSGSSGCTIIDAGHRRERDLALELPLSPLQAVTSSTVWDEVYDRLATLIAEHRTSLIFVNTRRMAERVARHLSERVGAELVTAHHGSMAREQRHSAERRLKAGELRALVATASLELGIDIGEIDLVCQLSSPRAIAIFLQRVGRSGHALDRVPKGRLFPLTRDDLVECTALLDAVRRGELDTLHLPEQPVDVLCQHIVAMVASEEWAEADLYERVCKAYPYRALTREVFGELVQMLADGFSTRRGRRSAYLHRDAVHGRLRTRRGAMLTAVTCGGAIPGNADYEVREESSGAFVGTLNEDFAIESLVGDIFQLGNTAWRIMRVTSGVVYVEDAHGQPPNIPFWLGEAPARSNELSLAVARLRAKLEPYFAAGDLAAAHRWLQDELRLQATAASQLTEYLAASFAALQCLPTHTTLVLERFFDESGGMQLVLHSPYGSRINRAWGLALRKRFCRRFNFELQAAATEDAVVLSLGETQSFVLADVWEYLHASTVREVLLQALLDAPMFNTHWRWNAMTSLAIARVQGGKKIPPRLLRMQAEDLVTLLFPDQLACPENLAGRRDVPEHPLVQQTVQDCMCSAMDVAGLERILRAIETGQIETKVRDLCHPSPLAQEILTAKPYAFLDDAPLEERRTHAVSSRRWLAPAEAADLGRLDAEAIANVCTEAWPDAESADELHDALLSMVLLCPDAERLSGPSEATPAWAGLFCTLVESGRAALLDAGNRCYWVATERVPVALAIFPEASLRPLVAVPPDLQSPWKRMAAIVELLRGRMAVLGPTTAVMLNRPFGLREDEIAEALAVLEQQGFILRGRFRPTAEGEEWCERRLLARIHRYTLQRLRREIEPLSTADFQRFLFRWHGVDGVEQVTGSEGLVKVVEQLAGFEAPAVSWERDLLPARISAYEPGWLDLLCISGRVVWRCVTEPMRAEKQTALTRSVATTLLPRSQVASWTSGRTAACQPQAGPPLSPLAMQICEHLARSGASFFDDLVQTSRLLKSQVEEALAELVARGVVHSDGFAGLRALLQRHHRRKAYRPVSGISAMDNAGRWSLSSTDCELVPNVRENDLETVAGTLLKRYGVVARKLLARESNLPPWRDLVALYRRQEARGDVRGGRFIAELSGEQFALPEAVSLLRSLRREPPKQTLVAISACDPLNLVGIVDYGQKIAAVATNRLLYLDGLLIAVLQGKDVKFLHEAATEFRWEYKKVLARLPRPLSSLH